MICLTGINTGVFIKNKGLSLISYPYIALIKIIWWLDDDDDDDNNNHSP